MPVVALALVNWIRDAGNQVFDDSSSIVRFPLVVRIRPRRVHLPGVEQISQAHHIDFFKLTKLVQALTMPRCRGALRMFGTPLVSRWTALVMIAHQFVPFGLVNLRTRGRGPRGVRPMPKGGQRLVDVNGFGVHRADDRRRLITRTN